MVLFALFVLCVVCKRYYLCPKNKETKTGFRLLSSTFLYFPLLFSAGYGFKALSLGAGDPADACLVCPAYEYGVQGNSDSCQPCASGSYTNAGTGTGGSSCTTCATSGLSNYATITCTSGTNQVAATCNAGYGLVGSECGACDAFTYAVQGNTAECQPCASGSYTDTGTGTTGTTCSTCATSGKGANAATVTCTDDSDQVATTCNAGYGFVVDHCNV